MTDTVRNKTGIRVTMSDQNGKHFKAVVPVQGECAGRSFVVLFNPVSGSKVTSFRCLKCNRELTGFLFPNGESKLDTPGGHLQ